MSTEATDSNPQPQNSDSSDESTFAAPETEVVAEAAANSAHAEQGDTEEPQEVTPEMLDRYECDSCGYIYEPVKGDGMKTAAGTSFKEIPSTWRCLVCGAPKRQFRNIGPVGSPSGFKENLGYGMGVNTLTPGQKNILIFGGLVLGFIFFISLYGLN
ncbi:MAG: rubredoxin [Elainellaceae cyanobacterium]